MDTSDIISLIGVGVSVVALLISVISIYWARRAHLSVNVPPVSTWLNIPRSETRGINQTEVSQKTKVYGHIRNDSQNVSLVDVAIEVTVSQRERLIRHKSRLLYSKEQKHPIRPGENESIEVTPVILNVAGFDVGPGLEEFLSDGDVCSLRAIDQTDPFFKRYSVLNSSPIKLTLKVKYRPALHGFKPRTIKWECFLVPKTLPLNNTQILTGWDMREKRR